MKHYRLFEIIGDETKMEASQISKAIVDGAKDHAEEKARRIIGLAIQRYAGEHTYEATTATILLNGDEEIKGRIIGREGRNVRAFETATGVTVLIDDTPNTVVLSGFDPIKREIARESMARLVKDGRIHPTRIEEVVSKVTEENNYNLTSVGEEAAQKAGVSTLSQEVLSVLGKLRYRSSYSQNVLAHSVEVAHLMGLLAGEMGLDISKAKRIGLLHDIGKAMSEEAEGPHAIVGADFLKRVEQFHRRGRRCATLDWVGCHSGITSGFTTPAGWTCSVDPLLIRQTRDMPATRRKRPRGGEGAKDHWAGDSALRRRTHLRGHNGHGFAERR